MRSRSLVVSALCASVAGHAAGARPAGATASPPALTLEDKLAQMLIVMLKGTEVTPALEARLRETPVGGVILYAGNVVSREQLQRFSAQLTAALPIAPLIAVDQEGGPVSRLRPPLLAALPGHMALGATRDAALAREAASVQARELLRLGLNTNFAPVLDLAHPRNAPIGVRAFSDDPGLVSSLGRAWIEGQQEAGVVTFAKHFPGHGDSEVDSHVKLPVLDLGAAELEPQLRVWRGALAGGLDGIMMAHVALPRLDADGLPASLSSAVIDGLLRSKLGYDGVVMTDALAMISVQERLALGPAAVASARAGADMLMVPEYAAKAVLRQLADAVRAGTLAPEKVDAAVERVLRLKRRRGLQPARAASPAPGAGTAAGDARARRIEEVVDAVARGAVTLLRREAGSFPLEPQQRVLFATTDEDLEPPTQDAAGTETMLFAPGPAPTPAERARLCAAAARADAIVVAGGPAGLAELVAAARACSRPLVVLATGTPWAAGAIAEPATVLLLYSSSRPSVKAAFDVIFGREQARGAAPVRDVR